MPHKDPAARKAYQARRYQERRSEFLALEKARYDDNRETIRQRRLELAYKHRATNNERERERYSNWRAIVLARYGSKCACCGETQPLFLEIDHINNGGAEHRRLIGRSAKALIRWLIDHDCPPDFQLLCANCNQGKKRNGGICPHQQR